MSDTERRFAKAALGSEQGQSFIHAHRFDAIQQLSYFAVIFVLGPLGFSRNLNSITLGVFHNDLNGSRCSCSRSPPRSPSTCGRSASPGRAHESCSGSPTPPSGG